MHRGKDAQVRELNIFQFFMISVVRVIVAFLVSQSVFQALEL